MSLDFTLLGRFFGSFALQIQGTGVSELHAGIGLEPVVLLGVLRRLQCSKMCVRRRGQVGGRGRVLKTTTTPPITLYVIVLHVFILVHLHT